MQTFNFTDENGRNWEGIIFSNGKVVIATVVAPEEVFGEDTRVFKNVELFREAFPKVEI
jgi:hypothetical protein